MKAEHRKELQTNILADRMGRVVQSFQSKSSTTTIICWVLTVLTLGTFVAWMVASRPSEADAKNWVALETETYNRSQDYLGHSSEVIFDLNKIVTDSPYTMAGRTARFQKARYLLPMGLKNLATPAREEAILNVVEARKLYSQLLKECGDNPMLLQEALLGAAQSEEALLGVPDSDKGDGSSYGDFEKSLQLYRRLKDTADPKSYMGRQAARHVEEMENNSTEIKKFYADLNQRTVVPQPIPTSKPSNPHFPDMFKQ